MMFGNSSPISEKSKETSLCGNMREDAMTGQHGWDMAEHLELSQETMYENKSRCDNRGQHGCGVGAL